MYQVHIPDKKCGWAVYKPRITKEKYRRDHVTMVVHKKDVKHLSLT